MARLAVERLDVRDVPSSAVLPASFQGGCSTTTDVSLRADLDASGPGAALVARYSGPGDSNMYMGALAEAAGGSRFYHILPYIEQENLVRT